MKIYLVGGAVRDQLLGRKVKERDWVVVGASPEIMLKKGFKPVGKDFPVFLHPKTHEEYALARTERKVGEGYHGFTFHAESDVTLEEDLIRRDLTINAIAQRKDGTLIDPFHGQADLKQKRLRHVSEAFAEDPVRILRVARFAARLSDFNVDPSTNELMKNMVKQGEVDALVAERVWQEWQRALTETAPERFFQTLIDCNAQTILFPEITKAGVDRLTTIAKKTKDALFRFAGLLENMTTASAKALCKRFKVPNEYSSFAFLAAEHRSAIENTNQLNADKLLTLIERCDAFRRPERFQNLLTLNLLCHPENQDQINAIKQAYNAANSITAASIMEDGFQGKEISEELHRRRIVKIHAC